MLMKSFGNKLACSRFTLASVQAGYAMKSQVLKRASKALAFLEGISEVICHRQAGMAINWCLRWGRGGGKGG